MSLLRSPLRAAAGLAVAATLALGIAAPGALAAGCALQPGASCHNANLAGQDLGGRDLRRIDLTGSSLKGTKLVGTNLEGAILKHADLRGATLDRATLTGANLEKADLEGATVIGATALRADFRHAKVRVVDFRSTNLQGAQFGGADASAASFQHAHVQDASFHTTELHSANFAHATFGNTNFDASKVYGIHLFPSKVGDDAVARRGLFFHVYLHLDAYSDFGHCADTDAGAVATHRSRGIGCFATGDGATTIPRFRGAKQQWGWHEYGLHGYFSGTDHASLAGSFDAPAFTVFNVKHIANLGLAHAYLPTGDGRPGHPGGPFLVSLTARTYNPQGSFRYGYIQRLSGYLQRAG